MSNSTWRIHAMVGPKSYISLYPKDKTISFLYCFKTLFKNRPLHIKFYSLYIKKIPHHSIINDRGFSAKIKNTLLILFSIFLSFYTIPLHTSYDHVLLEHLPKCPFYQTANVIPFSLFPNHLKKLDYYLQRHILLLTF